MFTMKAPIDFTIHPMLIELHVKLLLLPRHNKIHCVSYCVEVIHTHTHTHTCSHIIIIITCEFESKL